MRFEQEVGGVAPVPEPGPVTAPAGRFIRQGALLLLVLHLLAGCASLVRREANEQLAAGQPEAALRTLEAGLRKHPEDVELRAAYLRTRASQVDTAILEAERARQAGRPDDAERLLARALTLDPTQERARELLRSLGAWRQQERVRQDAKVLLQRGQDSAALRLVDEALKGGAAHEGLAQLRRSAAASLRERQLRAARSGLTERRPISLDFRDAGLRQVLDLVTRHSGLNFVLDKDVRADLRITVHLNDVPVDDALDLIVSTHQLARKVLDSRTVLLYPNTAEKQREYQEQVIRVFYLASADAKGAAAFLRGMLKLREPFVDERSNMLALRDSPEAIALAERLVQIYDTPEPEVMLELEVLEVRSTRLTELGVKLPNTVTLTPLATGAAGFTVANLRDIGTDRIGVSLSGVTFNLRREVGDFEILANPKVRAKNREKAKVLIGDKVPIITTTSSQSGFVSDSVSYIDVGLKLDIEPTIYANDEVSIKLALEVGSLAGQIKTTSGTTAYQISTRNASTSLRLRDGETQLLAGLLSREDRTSASRVPLAGDVPVLGRLFSNQLDDGSRTELILAITPRIVRNIRAPDASEAELWIGTEAYTRLRPAGGVAPAALAERAPDGRTPTAGAGDADPRSQQSGPAGQTPSDGTPRLAPTAPSAPPPPAAAPAAPISLRWEAPATAKVGQPLLLQLAGQLPVPLRGLTLQVQAPVGALRQVTVEPLGLFQQDGQKVAATSSLDAATGLMSLGVLRREASDVAGGGEILSVRLTPARAGPLALSVAKVTPISMDSQAVAVEAMAPLVLQVQP